MLQVVRWRARLSSCVRMQVVAEFNMAATDDSALQDALLQRAAEKASLCCPAAADRLAVQHVARLLASRTAPATAVFEACDAGFACYAEHCVCRIPASMAQPGVIAWRRASPWQRALCVTWPSWTPRPASGSWHASSSGSSRRTARLGSPTLVRTPTGFGPPGQAAGQLCIHLHTPPDARLGQHAGGTWSHSTCCTLGSQPGQLTWPICVARRAGRSDADYTHCCG